MKDTEEKTYSKKQMRSYALYCMTRLLTKYPYGKDEMGEISSVDIDRINDVLNNNKLSS